MGRASRTATRFSARARRCRRSACASCKELHARAYHPSQIVVACSGNVAHEQLLEALERHRVERSRARRCDAACGAASTPAAAIAQRTWSARARRRTSCSARRPWRTSDPRRYAVALVDTIFGGGMSSRLFQRIREELGLAYSVHTFQSFHPDTGVAGVYVGTSPETATQAAEAIDEELDKLATQSLTEEEIRAGKSQLKGQVTLSLESVTSRMYRAAGVALYRRAISFARGDARAHRRHQRGDHRAGVRRILSFQPSNRSEPRPCSVISRARARNHLTIRSRAMRIGVPKEIKTNENRVALVPAGCEALVANGHTVLDREGRGRGKRLRG